MKGTGKIVGQIANLPATVAAQQQQEFLDLAERFRSATDSEEVKQLGDQMGRRVFGN